MNNHKKRYEAIESAISGQVSELETLADEMEEYADARSEKWQEGKQGVAYQNNIETLRGLVGDLTDTLDNAGEWETGTD